MPSVHPTYCRVCLNGCPILVEVDQGRPIRVTGDSTNDLYAGYTCVKGRALPELHTHPNRLLHSQKRMRDGTFRPISSEDLMDEVAVELGRVLDAYGPQAVASYFGTAAANVNTVTIPMSEALLHAMGSTMKFNPETIDQAGKQVARSLHGVWLAPSQGFDDPDVVLVFGANPLVSYLGGLPMGHPGRRLRQWFDRGLSLIVVDPRRSDFAKRSTIHLQPRPGHDAAILAAMIRVILSEGLHDRQFVDENVDGVDELRLAVDAFTPEVVGGRADIDPKALVDAARLFAQGRRGFAVAGTGPNMSGPGTLLEYLILNLNTLCGRWLRAGEVVRAPSTVMAPMPAKAQAIGPFPGIGTGDALPGSDLRPSISGPPIAGLVKAMLHGGEDRTRVLLSFGGNPAVAWPDQVKVVEALRALELLVQVDVAMTPTAQLAHYVVAPKMSLETPSFTLMQDAIAYFAAGYAGHAEPWAQYTDSVVDVPPGSDLLDEWEFVYGLAGRLGLQLELGSIIPWVTAPKVPLDMRTKPTTEQLLEILARDSRIPLDEVKRHPHGAVFPHPEVVVEPRDPDCTDRLDVASSLMMEDLRALLGHANDADQPTPLSEYPFRLISRRVQKLINSLGRNLQHVPGRQFNPAYMHPDDLDELGLEAGQEVEIRSARGSVRGIVEPDGTLRRGLVSMTHAYGGLPDAHEDVQQQGVNTGRLLQIEQGLQPYTGQPRMSNVPVTVSALTAPTEVAAS